MKIRITWRVVMSTFFLLLALLVFSDMLYHSCGNGKPFLQLSGRVQGALIVFLVGIGVLCRSDLK